MKTTAIDTAAVWGANLSTWQNGDTFNEANADTVVDTIGDRLGYLKTALDAKAGTGTANTFTEAQEIDDALTVNGDAFFLGAVETGAIVTSGSVTVNGALEFDASSSDGVVTRYMTGSDAAATITAAYDEVRVPTLTANRIWTVEDDPAPRDGARIRFYRASNLDAYTLTIRRETAVSGVTTLGVLNASAVTWLEICFQSGRWVVSGWSNDVSSIASTV